MSGSKRNFSGWTEHLEALQIHSAVMGMCYGVALQDLALRCLNLWTLQIGIFICSSSCWFQINVTLKRATSVRLFKSWLKSWSGKCWLLSKISHSALQHSKRAVKHFTAVQASRCLKPWLLKVMKFMGTSLEYPESWRKKAVLWVVYSGVGGGFYPNREWVDRVWQGLRG